MKNAHKVWNGFREGRKFQNCENRGNGAAGEGIESSQARMLALT